VSSELLTGLFALGGAFIGFLGNVILNRLDLRKRKNESVLHERQVLFISIADVVSDIPTERSEYALYKTYYESLDSYFKKNIGKLVLYGDPEKIADKFSEYYILFQKYIEFEDCQKHHAEFVTKGQEIINAIKRYFNIRVV